jgi:CBS domain-containing protein
MNELQYKMKAKSRYQPSKTVEALFTTAVVRIKADADKAIAKQKAMSETEVVSAKAGVEAKTKEPILEQKVEPETESFDQTGTNEMRSEAEPVSQQETTETFEREAEQEAGAAEQKAEDADTAFEDVAEGQEPAADEVSKSIQQMAQSQSNQPREQSLAGSGLCAKDVMLKELVWGSPEDSVQQAITKMQQYDSGYLMVGIDGVLEGIVSNSNITGALSPYLRPVFAKWRRPLDDATLQIRIKWIMSRPVRTVKPETSLVTIIGNMCQFSQHVFPVVDEQGKVQGLVTVFGIFKVLSNSTSISMVGKASEAHPLEQFHL